MTTVSPSRKSLRAMSSALCSVAIETVDPATNTGSSTAYGVFAPVRPTFTSIFSSFVWTCWAGNLNAVAQRGNLAVVPSRSRKRQVIELDDHAVGVEFELQPLVRPPVAEGDHLRRCRCTAGSASRPAIPSCASRPAVSACVFSDAVGGTDQLIRERGEPTPPHERRIQVPHGAGRGIPGIGEDRFPLGLAFGIDPGKRRCAERRPRRALRSGRPGHCAARAESTGSSGRSP